MYIQVHKINVHVHVAGTRLSTHVAEPATEERSPSDQPSDSPVSDTAAAARCAGAWSRCAVAVPAAAGADPVLPEPLRKLVEHEIHNCWKNGKVKIIEINRKHSPMTLVKASYMPNVQSGSGSCEK